MECATGYTSWSATVVYVLDRLLNGWSVAAPSFPKAMVRWNGLFTQWNRYWSKALTHTSLLTYWWTPFPWCGRSPLELMMGRCLNLTTPNWWVFDSLSPRIPWAEQSFQRETEGRLWQTSQNTGDPDDTEVFIKTEGEPTSGYVRTSAETPRSYIVETQSGSV